MYEALKGKSILIGKEPDKGRLLVAVKIKGETKLTVIGEAGSVPGGVSRCIPSQGVGHCRLDVGVNGDITMTNLKARNVTLVDGIEFDAKRVTTKNTLELGSPGYKISVKDLLDTAEKLVFKIEGKPAVTVSIRHLERVWNEYHDEYMRIKKHQRFVSLMSSVPMMFTLGAGALTAMAPRLELPPFISTVTLTLTIIGFILMVYGFCLRLTDKSIEENEQLLENLQDRYVCPNKECRHFLGNQPFKIIRQMKKCPHCGATYEK